MSTHIHNLLHNNSESIAAKKEVTSFLLVSHGQPTINIPPTSKEVHIPKLIFSEKNDTEKVGQVVPESFELRPM